VTCVEPGRHELDGSRVFVNVEAYTTRPVERCAWEAHRRYADIQFLVRGRERIDYAAASMLKRTQAYDSERDVTFYAGDGAPLQLTEGMFAIFLPQDAHRPCVAVGEPEAVRKAVAKVLLAETP